MPLTSVSRAVPTRTACSTAARILALATMAAMALLVMPHSVRAQSSQSEVVPAEHALFDALNRERTAQGLPALHWDEALASAAREHAARMAQRNVLSHQLPGEPAVQDRATRAGARFSLIAENIAVAPTPGTIHSAWMQSPHHRENILDPQLNGVGIAVIKGGDGLFAVQDFSQSVANLSYSQQEQVIVANLHARGLPGAQVTNDARKTCDMEHGFAGARPLAVVRFESANLSKLPQDLEQKLRSGKYHAATVGACPGGSSGPFTRFRIAVVLY
ncbi:MAG: CAP domain-containing protein [Acidobacteriota bacterium]|nr:CAP domain-containing protein [Acidobacteriota bacterium]